MAFIDLAAAAVLSLGNGYRRLCSYFFSSPYILICFEKAKKGFDAKEEKNDYHSFITHDE